LRRSIEFPSGITAVTIYTAVGILHFLLPRSE